VNLKPIALSLSLFASLAHAQQPAVTQPPPPPPPPTAEPAMPPPPPPDTTVAPVPPAPAANTAKPDAPAADPNARKWKYVDAGITFGFNNPGGIYGVEAEVRLFTQYVGFRVAGGNGAWGVRASGLLRGYPLGLSYRAAPFAEVGLSINSGGNVDLTVNGQTQTLVQRDVTPVATFAAGGRVHFVDNLLFLEGRVGWAQRLHRDNMRWANGDRLEGIAASAMNAFQHEGFMIGLVFGVSVL
jgi:hypothetical protein